MIGQGQAGPRRERGDGTQNADLARALLLKVLEGFGPSKKFVSAARRPHLVGIFTEVWQRLLGSRSAMFLNEEPQKSGLLSMVAILDTADAERFLTEMKQLSMFINNRGLKLAEAGDDGIDKATVNKLIGQLGDDAFRVREGGQRAVGGAGAASGRL